MALKTAMVLAFMLLLGWSLWTPDLDRADLERQYARAGSQFVQTPGLRTHLPFSYTHRTLPTNREVSFYGDPPSLKKHTRTRSRM